VKQKKNLAPLPKTFDSKKVEPGDEANFVQTGEGIEFFEGED